MANYGIRIINQATGSVQIDQNYRNRELVGIYDFVTQPNPVLDTTNPGQPAYLAGYSYFQLPAGMSSEVYFVGPYYVCRRGLSTLDNGNYSNIYVADAPAGTSITGYVFSDPTEAVSGGWGLRVLDAAGNVTFNSNYWCLNLADIVTGSNYSTSMPGKALPAGRTYAVRPLQWSGRLSMKEDRRWLPGSSLMVYDIEEYGLMMRMNGSALQCKEARYIKGEQLGFDINYGGGYDESYVKYDYAIAIADVTYFANP